MPTKTEYRAYIASEAWQKRRKEFLSTHDRCARCELPRLLALSAYDQDLHVHHLSYANVGAEPDEDLEPLCKRCHEIQTFGVSELHEMQKFICPSCYSTSFSPHDYHLHEECKREIEEATGRDWKTYIEEQIRQNEL